MNMLSISCTCHHAMTVLSERDPPSRAAEGSMQRASARERHVSLSCSRGRSVSESASTSRDSALTVAEQTRARHPRQGRRTATESPVRRSSCRPVRQRRGVEIREASSKDSLSSVAPRRIAHYGKRSYCQERQ